MRTPYIRKDILYTLRRKEDAKGIGMFQSSCEDFSHCKGRARCTERCLIPKLRYMSLSVNSKEIEKIIARLDKE